MSFFEESNEELLSIMKIADLSLFPVEHLVVESKQAGFCFFRATCKGKVGSLLLEHMEDGA